MKRHKTIIQIIEWLKEKHEGTFIDTRKVERMLKNHGHSIKLADYVAGKALGVK